MNLFGLRFHHLGLAAPRPDDAKTFLAGLGYEIGDPVFDPEQNTNLIMCRHEGSMPDVEIIFPATGKSPVDTLLNRRPDGLVYHVCYVTADLSDSLMQMQQAGVRAACVARPTPAILFDGREVSFYNIVGMGLCEIINDPEHSLP